MLTTNLTLRRAALRAIATALACAGAAASPAHAAGTYVDAACANGTGAFSDAYGGWSSYNTHAIPGATTGANCGNGTLQGEITPANGYSFPVGNSLGWNFAPPANTYVTAFKGALAGWVDPWDGQNEGFLELVGSSGRLQGFEPNRNTDLSPSPFAFNATGLHDSSLAVRLWCYAPDGNYPDCAPPWQTGWFGLSNINVSLADDAGPAPGAVSGSAVSDVKWVGTENMAYAATDQGGGIAAWRLYVDGVPVDSYKPDAFGGHCQPLSTAADGAWVFGYPKPCPGSVSDTHGVDSTVLADGQHTVTAKVVDAAQREGTLWSGSRVIANHPPINNVAPAYTAPANAGAPVTGVTLGATDGSWSGPSLTYSRAWQQCDASGTGCVQIADATGATYTPVPGDLGHRLRFAVTATNAADSVTAYSPMTGVVSTPSSNEAPTPKPTDGSNGGSGAGGAGGAGGATGSNGANGIAVPGLQTTNTTNINHLLMGHVAGEPAGTACPQDRATLVFQHVGGGQVKLAFGRASTAQLQLTCTVDGKAIEGAKLEIATKTGSRPVVAADVTTDGAGHATLRLATGASRGITVGYRMYADDPMARAVATLKVLVPGKVDLKASRTRLRNGGVVSFKGRLRGGMVPRRGVNLAVQWKDGGKWRPFAQIKTSRTGTFRYAYRFTRTSRTVTYRLRVRMSSGQVDYPYTVASSKTVKVTVAP